MEAQRPHKTPHTKIWESRHPQPKDWRLCTVVRKTDVQTSDRIIVRTIAEFRMHLVWMKAHIVDSLPGKCRVRRCHFEIDTVSWWSYTTGTGCGTEQFIGGRIGGRRVGYCRPTRQRTPTTHPITLLVSGDVRGNCAFRVQAIPLAILEVGMAAAMFISA